MNFFRLGHEKTKCTRICQPRYIVSSIVIMSIQEIKEAPIDSQTIEESFKTLRRFINPTPFRSYERMNRDFGLQCFVKHDHHLPTGSFKVRGGLTLLAKLKEQRVSEVVTYSTGNHGLSIAYTAKAHDITPIVVLPNQASQVKASAISDCGASLIFRGDSFDEASQHAFELALSRGAYLVHPANEPVLISGVGSCFAEMLDQEPDLDFVIIPLGGGSEVASAVKYIEDKGLPTRVIAVQAQESCAAFLSWQSGAIISSSNGTAAGGFATGSAYELPFSIYKNGLYDFVLLSEEEIMSAIGLAWYYTHSLVEGAGAAALYVAFKLREKLKGKKVGIQMSGANASVEELRAAISRRESEFGIKLRQPTLD